MDVGLLSGLANALTFANIGFALIGTGVVALTLSSRMVVH